MYLFFDVETTGLPTRRGADYTEIHVWPRIVSISWAFFRDPATQLKHFYSIIQPDGFDIPIPASRVHGITTQRAQREGAPLATVLGALCQDVANHAPQLLVAHNMDFDRPILLAELLRLRLVHDLAHLKVCCTMQTSTHVCRIPRPSGGYKWPTLDELHRRLFGTGISDAHDASADVLHCAKCYFKLRELGFIPADPFESGHHLPRSGVMPPP